MTRISKLLTLLITIGILTNCTPEQISPEELCIKGEVIGKIRTAGGGLAVSLDEPREGAVTWQGEENVIELLNIPVELTFPGTVIYFEAREAKQSEQGPISADGEETINLLLFGTYFSDVGCRGE